MPNTYQKGDLVRCTGTFTDSDGTVTDPTTIKFDFRDPSNNKTTYTYVTDAELVKDSTGVYHVDVDADESGEWWYRFYSTGTGQAADEEPFIVEKSQF